MPRLYFEPVDKSGNKHNTQCVLVRNWNRNFSSEKNFVFEWGRWGDHSDPEPISFAEIVEQRYEVFQHIYSTSKKEICYGYFFERIPKVSSVSMSGGSIFITGGNTTGCGGNITIQAGSGSSRASSQLSFRTGGANTTTNTIQFEPERIINKEDEINFEFNEEDDSESMNIYLQILKLKSEKSRLMKPHEFLKYAYDNQKMIDIHDA